MKHTRAEVPGKIDRETHFSANLDNYGKPGVEVTEDRIADLDTANLLTSLPADRYVKEARLHAPVIDLDLPCELIPSTTPGHFHLILGRLVPEREYWRLLVALADAGLVEHGYVSASRARGQTAIRLPWVKKKGGGMPVLTEGAPADDAITPIPESAPADPTERHTA